MTDPVRDHSVVADDLLTASSLGRPEVVEVAGAVPADEVDDVLTRLAHLDARVAEGRRAVGRVEPAEHGSDPGDGPLDEWRRERERLLARAAGREVPEQLRPLVSGELPPSEVDRRLLTDVDLTRALVDAAGGDWAQGRHRRLLRNARVQVGIEPPRTTARRSVSGFTVAVHQAGPLRTATAPAGPLPVLRGRDTLIARLLRTATDPGAPTTVLIGDAGYGKSTTALAVAQRAESLVPGLATMWVVAQDTPSLVDGLERVAAQLEVTSGELEGARDADPAGHARRLWSAIDRRAQRWLLVIDDAGHDAVGNPAWLHRPRHGTVLVTSRYGDERSWGASAVVVPARRLEPEHGGSVLLDVVAPAGRRLSSRVLAQARRASELLSGMPLALTSVGTLLRSDDGGGLDELVAALRRRDQGEGALATAYGLCLDAVGSAAGPPGDRAAARRLLRLLSCFAPDEPLPRRVVEGRAEGDVAALVRVGLVDERVVDSEPVLLVQTAVAEHARRDTAFTDDDVAALDLEAVSLLLAELDRLDPGAPRDWSAVSALEPHVAEVLESPALTTPAAAGRALELADRACEGLMRLGDHTTATTLLDRAAARFSWLPVDDPALLAVRRTRAWMIGLEAGGDLRRAGQLLVGLLAETRDVLGDEHLTTLAVQDCLGWVRAEQGDLMQAYTLLDEVQQVRSRVLGAGHPATLATLHRLGWIIAMRGRPEDAVAVLDDVLTARRRRLGSQHLDVFSTRYRLAWALMELGRHAEAERTYRDLMLDAELALGARHPLTLMVRGRLAWALSWLNRCDEAEALYEDLLDDQQKVLGVDHPRVATTGHYQAMLWLRRGRVADAEARLRAVGDRREEVLGADHPLTLYTRSYQAWAQFQLGDVTAAQRGLQAVFADRVGVLGERHKDTLVTRYLLARVLLHRGKLVEAEGRLRGLLDDMGTVFAPDHRRVLHTRVALAAARGFQDDVLGAETILRGVVGDRTRTLGADHRETLTARDQLAWALGRGRRFEEASKECAAVLAARVHTLGADHPHTLTSRYRQAWIVLRRGDHEAARDRFAALLGDLRRTLEEPGAPHDRHPDTLQCRMLLVATMRLDGDVETASTEGEALVADMVASLGEDAVATMRGREELGRLAAARGDGARARAIHREVLERRRRVLGDDHADTLRSREDVENPG